MLVISHYFFAVERFDCRSNNWKNSVIRKWLNDDFYNKAFTDQEKKFIISSNLSDVGTTDNMFLLSKVEADKYFANNNARICCLDEKGEQRKEGRTWWLRSPYVFYDDHAFFVDRDGQVRCNKVSDCFYVRPAMWIKL